MPKKKTPAQKLSRTEINCLLDRSGSIVTIMNAIKVGFDSLIKEQAQVEGECYVSLSQFNTVYEEIYSNLEISKVPALELVPKGNTALYDGIGHMIGSVRARHQNLAVADRPEKTIFIIMTDGQENASREFNLPKVKEMISQARLDGYEIIFLGAEENAMEVAGNLGINIAVQYNANDVGSQAVFTSLSRAMTNSRSSRGSDGSLRAMSYDQQAYNTVLEEVQANVPERVLTVAQNLANVTRTPT